MQFRFDLLERDKPLSGKQNGFGGENQQTAIAAGMDRHSEGTPHPSGVDFQIGMINLSGDPKQVGIGQVRGFLWGDRIF
jgi:hypothetical protein